MFVLHPLICILNQSDALLRNFLCVSIARRFPSHTFGFLLSAVSAFSRVERTDFHAFPDFY